MTANNEKISPLSRDVVRTPDGFMGLDIPRSEVECTKALSSSSGDLNTGTSGGGGSEGAKTSQEEMWKGNFGQVMKGYCYGMDVAIKRLTATRERDKESFRREATLMSEINHPNICRLLGACFEGDDPHQWMLIFELCKTDLQQLCTSRKAISLYKRLFYGWEIAKGMIAVSCKGIIHRDLKPANILVGWDGTIKIADFGFAKKCPQLAEFTGSLCYMSPEVMINKFEATYYTEKADVYSFGMLLWFLINRLRPYPNYVGSTSRFIGEVNSGLRPDIPADSWGIPGLSSLLDGCWKANPSDRPTFSEIEKAFHPILRAVIPTKNGRFFWETNFPGHFIVKWTSFFPAFLKQVGFVDDLHFDVVPCSSSPLPDMPSELELQLATQSALKNWCKLSKQYDLVAKEFTRRHVLLQMRCLRRTVADMDKEGRWWVDIEKFARTINLFGPLDDTILIQSNQKKCPNYEVNGLMYRVHHLWQQPWFHDWEGNAQKMDAAYDSLCNQEPGTFLVRFSSNLSKSAFVVSMVMRAGRRSNEVVHSEVTYVPGAGFRVAGAAISQHFVSIEEAVSFLLKKKIVKQPCPELSSKAHLFL
eukprot:CAMPEP_0174238770 /NCGR_PEP_ID=MMETSP0417-20130205/12412_1 /TAXON_ID=242541 /ORGANISM="Mayorella sp, Strain BSH-02190019" /LENGTH=587 /DNA_ID=CAMNT_0015317653 /DNA_START=120 /DNA_END=1879 /DNA_ORIENTATION=+